MKTISSIALVVFWITSLIGNVWAIIAGYMFGGFWMGVLTLCIPYGAPMFWFFYIGAKHTYATGYHTVWIICWSSIIMYKLFVPRVRIISDNFWD